MGPAPLFTPAGSRRAARPGIGSHAMFTIKIRQQKRPGERWHLIAEVTADLAQPGKLPEPEVSESNLLSFQIVPPRGSTPAVHITVGNVLVASSIRTERVFLID